MVSTLMYHTLESEIDAAMFLGSSYKQIMLMYPATHVIGQMLESGDYACHMDIYVYCFGANIKELTLFLVYPGQVDIRIRHAFCDKLYENTKAYIFG